MSDVNKETLETIRKMAWDAVGTKDNAAADKALVDIHEYAKKQAARAGQAASVPEGWKLVPINPTGEMLGKMKHQIDGYHNGTLVKRYHEMLDVAPPKQEQDQ